MKLAAKRLGPVSLVVAMLVAISMATECGGDRDRPIRPDLVCPGDETCPDQGESVLYVGTARRDVTPDIIDYQTHDEDGDCVFEPPPLGHDEWHDGNDNGEWDFIYIAGLWSPRPAAEVRDPIWSRVMVLRWKQTTIALVALDVIGYFRPDIDDIRESVADLGIDYVSVSATHNHEGPDTVGIWGMDEMWPGWRQETFDRINARTEEAIREAYGNMQPASVRYGAIAADRNPENGLCAVQSDGRDPVIMPEMLTVMHFQHRDTSDPIGTLVHFTHHPEVSDDRHQMLSSDFVHQLRLGLEEGIDHGDVHMEGLGGTAIFIQGPLGSQIGPGRAHCVDLDGTAVTERGFEKADCIGRNLAWMALQAIEEGTEPETDVPLEVKARLVELPVENYGYHAMMLGHIFHRYDLHGFDESLPVNADNVPWITTEISWIRIGRAQAVGLGGEPSPEIFIGGYDGSHTPQCAIDDLELDPVNLSRPDNASPPDLSLAPGPPYIFDRLEDCDYPMAWATTNDMLGYLIPDFDYVLAHPGAYVTEAEGHHYEETNSVGESVWPRIRTALIDMLEY